MYEDFRFEGMAAVGTILGVRKKFSHELWARSDLAIHHCAVAQPEFSVTWNDEIRQIEIFDIVDFHQTVIWPNFSTK